MKFNGTLLLKNKPQKRDRKSTLVLRPCHPDLKTAIDSLVAGKIPDAVLARIVTDSAAAALSLEGGAAQIDDSDAETSENANLVDEVRYFLIIFSTSNLTSFPPKRCMNRNR
jgi:hypothetical protein